ncbi:MAG: hypothetical protein IKA63_03470 [Clostridia bacterium]|nr:hypothetical protein [Clostridia bacterium]
MTKTMKTLKKQKLIRNAGIVFLAMLLMMVSLPVYTVTGEAVRYVYYVAANGTDTNDGLSPDTPFSFEKANTATFYGGDKVLFKRGDTFYGSFDPLINNASDTCRVEVGAYGDGSLPVLSNAKLLSSAWTQEGEFYKFDLTASGNYAGAVSDDTNVAFLEDSQGNKYYSLKPSAAACTATYDYYCDETGIHMKTAVDPYAELGTLTAAMGGTVFCMSPGMNIHDLHIQYGGYGIAWCSRSRVPRQNCGYVNIYDCIIEDIGGHELSRQSDGSIVRAGNGVELYDAGSHVVIENNIFRNIYDVAFSPQGGQVDDPTTSNNESVTSPGVWRDVKVNNNIFAYNTQALEVWAASQGADTGVQGLEFKNNLCIGQGEGWGYDARPEKWQAGDILAYGYQPDTWNMTLENNTFFHSVSGISVHTIYAYSAQKYLEQVTVNNSHIYQPETTDLVLYTTDTGGTAAYNGLRYTFAQWQANAGKDATGSWTAIGDTLANYAALEQAAATSNDFEAIVQAAKNAGLTVAVENRNLIADAVSVQLYEIRHDLNWQDMAPDYSNTTEMRLSHSHYGERGEFFGALWLPGGTSRADFDAAAAAALHDGDTATDAVKAYKKEDQTSLVAYYFGFGSLYNGLTDVSYTDTEGNAVTWKNWANSTDTSADMKAAKYRNALMYDLGSTHDLSKITISTSGRKIYGYSVYAGETNDATILSNCVGRVLESSGTQGVTVDLNGIGRYVLIVFDYLYTDPGTAGDTKWPEATRSTTYTGFGNTNLDGSVPLTEIVLDGNPLEMKQNLIADATSVQLYEIRHDLNWQNTAPNYSSTTEFRLSHGKYGGRGEFFGQLWINTSAYPRADFNAAAAEALYDRDTAVDVVKAMKTASGTSVCQYYYGLGGGATWQDVSYTNADGNAVTWKNWNNSTDSSTDMKAAKYRNALMYDLGVSHDLSKITIYGSGRAIYGYSVYAGETADKTILNNRIGRVLQSSGTQGVTVDLNGIGRYVLIVFDYLYTDPGTVGDTKWPETTRSTVYSGFGNNNLDGSVPLTEIVLEGEEAEIRSDLVANATDVKLYRVKHDLNWNETAPDYSGTTEFGLGGYNGDTSGKFFSGITDEVQANWVAALHDGDKSTTPYKTAANYAYYRGIGGVATNSSVTNTKTEYALISQYRYGLMYDLGSTYDLSKITLSFGSDRRPVYGYSVYAGATADKNILNNCIGRGGVSVAATLTAQMDTSATLNGTGRYVLIMFDFMHTDPGNKNDTLWGDAVTQSTTVSGYANPNCNGSIAVTEIVLEGCLN